MSTEVTEKCWTLSLEDYEDSRVLNIAIGHDSLCGDYLKRMAYEHKHPRKGKNTLKWQYYKKGLWDRWSAEEWIAGDYVITSRTIMVCE